MPLSGPRPPSDTNQTQTWVPTPQENDLTDGPPVYEYRPPQQPYMALPAPPPNPPSAISYVSDDESPYLRSAHPDGLMPEPRGGSNPPSGFASSQALPYQSMLGEGPYAPGWSRQQSIDQSSLRPSDSASNYAYDGDSDLSTTRMGPVAGPSKLAPAARPSNQRSNLDTLAEEGDSEGMSTMEILRRSGINIGLSSPSRGYHRATGGYEETDLRPSSIAGLSYVDENGIYYQADRFGRASQAVEPYAPDKQSLMAGAAGMGGAPLDLEYGEGLSNDKTYPPGGTGPFATSALEPEETGPLAKLKQFLQLGDRYPLAQQIENKRRGVGKQRWPYVCYTLTVAMCCVMIWELVSNQKAQGSPISTKPTFNYMIGPSSEVLINDGARFVPCMKEVTALPPTFQLACLNDTNNPPTTSCNLGDICGFGGIATGQTPNQWFRFILPIFMHVGIIHLAVNMAAQCIIGRVIEQQMGSVAFTLTYFAGGIYGFLLGGNFSRRGIPSAGASGALFAINACFAIDLALHWRYEDRPVLKAFLLLGEFLIGIAIGYIPYAVDGMAHLGGYAMGLLFGILLYPAITETKRRKVIVWSLRAVAVPIIIIAFVLTIKNFYTDDPNAACEWCRYLSCIPTSSNDYCKGTGITYSNGTNARRSWGSL